MSALDPLVRPTDPDTLVDLTDAPSAESAELLCATLRAFGETSGGDAATSDDTPGIPAFAFTAPGWMSPWEFGTTRPYRVQVRRADLDRARAALESLRQEWGAGTRGAEPLAGHAAAWDSVDVGAPEPDEPAALQSPDPAWADRRRDKVAAGRLVLLLASVATFGLFGALALAIEVVRRIAARLKPRAAPAINQDRA